MANEIARLRALPSAIAPTTAAFACDGEGLTMRCPSQCAKCAEKAAAALRLLRSFPGHFYEQAYNGWLNERDRLVGDAMDSTRHG
jgi:hypothetical protein